MFTSAEARTMIENLRINARNSGAEERDAIASIGGRLIAVIVTPYATCRLFFADTPASVRGYAADYLANAAVDLAHAVCGDVTSFDAN